MSIAHAGSLTLKTASEFEEVSYKENKELLVIASLKGCAVPEEQASKRAPVSITAVIDRSGSMQGQKLKMVKDSLQFVIDNLKDGDRLGLITYDDNVAEELPLTLMDSKGKNLARDRVKGVNVGGMTNLSGGLFAGLDQQSGKGTNPADYNKSGNANNRGGRGGYRNTVSNIGNTISGFFSSSSSNAATPTASKVPIEIGNIRQPTGTGSQLWTAIVKGVDDKIDKWVESVTFHLPSEHFSPSDVTVTTTPFELSRTSDKPVSLTIDIKLKSAYGGTTHSFNHNLNFEDAVTLHQHQLPIVETAHGAEKSVRSVWLFTDGLANVGITDPTQIVAQMSTKVKEFSDGRGCAVYSFGFGSDHNAQLLRKIAEHGSGMYYYIENEAQIAEAFGNCLGGLLSVVADQIHLVIQTCPGCTLLDISTPYKVVTDSPQQRTVNIPNIFGDEKRDTVFKLKMHSLPVAVTDNVDMVNVSVSYYDVLAKTQRDDLRVTCRVRRPEEAHNPEVPIEIDEQRNRMEALAAMEQARQLADEGKLADAKVVIQATNAKLKSSKSAKSAEVAMVSDELCDIEMEMDSMTQYKNVGSKKLASKAVSVAQQRSAGGSAYTAPQQAMCQAAAASYVSKKSLF